MADRHPLETLSPLELTAPAIQRLARKGVEEPLDAAERVLLCESVVFHIEQALRQSRIPKALRRPPAYRPTRAG